MKQDGNNRTRNGVSDYRNVPGQLRGKGKTEKPPLGTQGYGENAVVFRVGTITKSEP